MVDLNYCLIVFYVKNITYMKLDINITHNSHSSITGLNIVEILEKQVTNIQSIIHG